MSSKLKRKLNRAFSLLEVIITVAILSTAIVFIFQAFTTVLASSKFSQNITHACLLAEEKLLDIEQRQKESTALLDPDSGIQRIGVQDFKWDFVRSQLPNSNLIEVTFTVSWQENVRKKEYSIKFLTYLLPKK